MRTGPKCPQIDRNLNYDPWKLSLRGNRRDELTSSYSVRHMLGAVTPPASTINGDPFPWIILALAWRPAAVSGYLFLDKPVNPTLAWTDIRLKKSVELQKTGREVHAPQSITCHSIHKDNNEEHQKHIYQEVLIVVIVSTSMTSYLVVGGP